MRRWSLDLTQHLEGPYHPSCHNRPRRLPGTSPCGALYRHRIGHTEAIPIVIVAGLVSRLFLGFFVNPVLYEMVAREWRCPPSMIWISIAVFQERPL
jgi:hypothetical protein